MLMFSYGANLNKDAMRWRCPEARPLCTLMLTDARLVFRGVADCVYEKGAQCPGALWLITPRCERALDSFEGFRPSGKGAYRKEYVPVEGVPEGDEMMYYAMNSTGIYPPGAGYLRSIAQGYHDFGLPLDALQAAVTASWDDKAPSEKELARFLRDGQPKRAKRTGSSAFKIGPAQASLFSDAGV